VSSKAIVRDTADIREKMLQIWRLVDEKKISASEVRLHTTLARVVLETLKVELAAAHLARRDIPAVPLARRGTEITVTRQ